MIFNHILKSDFGSYITLEMLILVQYLIFVRSIIVGGIEDSS